MGRPLSPAKEGTPWPSPDFLAFLILATILVGVHVLHLLSRGPLLPAPIAGERAAWRWWWWAELGLEFFLLPDFLRDLLFLINLDKIHNVLVTLVFIVVEHLDMILVLGPLPRKLASGSLANEKISRFFLLDFHGEDFLI